MKKAAMKKISGLAASFVLIGTVTVGLSACGSESSSQDSVPVGEVTLTPASNLIDVRSAEEFATGAISGARNIVLENGDLEKALASMDKEAPYSVYCRSGRRSAVAVELMKKAGFSNVTDLGGIEQAAQALALPITQK
jgi:phage shock protein E